LRIFDDPDITRLTGDEVALLGTFEEIASSDSLICAVNYFSVNHATSQGRLQGFAANVLNLECPEEHTQSAEEYTAAHPVSHPLTKSAKPHSGMSGVSGVLSQNRV